jgi:hypothetical protein
MMQFAARSPHARRAPLPLAGRGWGWGSVFGATTAHLFTTPLPSPPPQGGREQAEYAARSQPEATR